MGEGVKVALVTLVITVYVPMAGGINGGVKTRSGQTAQTGMAACGRRYPFGTVFEILDEELATFGLPQVVVCMDRGGKVSSQHLDIALASGDVKGDLLKARAWGRRVRKVRVYASMDEYHEAHKPAALPKVDDSLAPVR
jgi:hypothetical protein